MEYVKGLNPELLTKEDLTALRVIRDELKVKINRAESRIYGKLVSSPGRTKKKTAENLYDWAKLLKKGSQMFDLIPVPKNMGGSEYAAMIRNSWSAFFKKNVKISSRMYVYMVRIKNYNTEVGIEVYDARRDEPNFPSKRFGKIYDFCFDNGILEKYPIVSGNNRQQH